MPLTTPADPAILERLPDPVMVVSAGAREQPGERRIAFANAAARDTSA